MEQLPLRHAVCKRGVLDGRDTAREEDVGRAADVAGQFGLRPRADEALEEIAAVIDAARRLTGNRIALNPRVAAIPQPSQPESLRVEDVGMKGSVLQSNRVLWRRRVEFRAMRLAPEDDIVIRTSANPGADW
jgi:hypothetical protein